MQTAPVEWSPWFDCNEMSKKSRSQDYIKICKLNMALSLKHENANIQPVSKPETSRNLFFLR